MVSFIFIWLQQEFSYDQFHEHKDRIYKVWNRDVSNGKVNSWDVTPRVLATTLKEEYSAVESAISYAAYGDQLLFIQGDKRLVKMSGVYADESILTLFSFPLKKGNVKTAFKDPMSIAITESFSRELFGDKEAFGETVIIGEGTESFSVVVTAVLKDPPSNTDLKFEYIIPFTLLDMVNGKGTSWSNNSVATYVKLKEGTDLSYFNEQVKEIVRKHYKDAGQREVFLYPLTKMHLYSRFENGVVVGGRIEILRLLGILSICLLIIACINFINLSTARAVRRAKEVAVRKVTGALRNSLIGQFLCESMLLTFGAGLLSLLAVYIGLPFFNKLINQQLTLEFANLNFWFVEFALVIIVGLLAGSYPAFYLSAFRPVKILKGTMLSQTGKNWFRTALVVFQFGMAIVLLVSVFVVQRQINYVQNRDVGYQKENLVFQHMTGTLGKNYEAYKNELLQRGVAQSITKTSAPITNRWSNTDGIEWHGKDPQNKTLFERIYVDQLFATTAGLTLVLGRDMDLQEHNTDSAAVLLNETAAKAMDFEDPIGEIIRDNGREWHVIGVVKDFILTSPFKNVEPVILFGCQQSWPFSVVHIKLNPTKPLRESIHQMSVLSKKYNPDYPFDYEFTDVAYARKFADLETTRTITLLVSFLTVAIAAMGLLGLSTYMIEARVKEIGIRKVLGSSVLGITKILTWSSLRPILIAVLIFGPQAWYAMNWWLSSYPYRISVGVLTIPLATTAVIVLAILVIGIQTIRAARANQVESLKNE